MDNFILNVMTPEIYSEVLLLWQECNIRIEVEDDLAHFEKFCSNSNGNGFVALEKVKIIGSVLCGTDGRYGYIHHLAVKPEYRNRGLGKQLVNACKNFFTDNSEIKTVAVFVWNHNQDGQLFWKKVGFEKAEGLEILSLTLEN